jgi:hypothetical protein
MMNSSMRRRSGKRISTVRRSSSHGRRSAASHSTPSRPRSPKTLRSSGFFGPVQARQKLSGLRIDSDKDAGSPTRSSTSRISAVALVSFISRSEKTTGGHIASGSDTAATLPGGGSARTMAASSSRRSA